MTGHWKKDARYGLQFEMESYEEIVGSDKRSIVAYLSSGIDLLTTLGSKVTKDKERIKEAGYEL